jgi:hypothetical protein
LENEGDDEANPSRKTGRPIKFYSAVHALRRESYRQIKSGEKTRKSVGRPLVEKKIGCKRQVGRPLNQGLTRKRQRRLQLVVEKDILKQVQEGGLMTNANQAELLAAQDLKWVQRNCKGVLFEKLRRDSGEIAKFAQLCEQTKEAFGKGASGKASGKFLKLEQKQELKSLFTAGVPREDAMRITGLSKSAINRLRQGPEKMEEDTNGVVAAEPSVEKKKDRISPNEIEQNLVVMFVEQHTGVYSGANNMVRRLQQSK